MSCRSKLTYSTPGICFTVVSSSFGIVDVQEAIFDFIRGIPLLLKDIGETSYMKHVNSVLNEKMTPDISLKEQAMRFWSEIDDGRLCFTMKEQQIEFFKGPPSFSEFLEFCSILLIPSPHSSVRALLVQCFCEASKELDECKRIEHPLFQPLAGNVRFLSHPSEIHDRAL